MRTKGGSVVITGVGSRGLSQRRSSAVLACQISRMVRIVLSPFMGRRSVSRSGVCGNYCLTAVSPIPVTSDGSRPLSVSGRPRGSR